MSWAALLPLVAVVSVLCARAEEMARLPIVEVGGAAFRVEIADDPQERIQGLSGRESLAQDAGMLFVYQEPLVPAFWMPAMRFPLDFVWIGEDCAVADITPDVPAPAPSTPDSELPTYTPAAPIRYNLEVNAGTAARHGITVGDAVRFRNVASGEC